MSCTSAAELMEVECIISLQESDYGLFQCFSTNVLQSEFNYVTTFWSHICFTHLTVVQKCGNISKNMFSPLLTSPWPVVLFLCSVVAASTCFIFLYICYILCFFRIVIFKLNILSVTVVILFLVAEMLVICFIFLWTVMDIWKLCVSVVESQKLICTKIQFYRKPF